jgi:hypothetical protein
MGLIIYGCLSALIKTGAFHKGSTVGLKQIIFTCFPYGLFMLLFFGLGLLLQFIVNDFVAVVMFRDKIRFKSAWSRALNLISQNVRNLVKFFFLQIGLGLCALVIASAISLIETVWLMIPVVILGTFFGLISLLLPVALRSAYFVILIIIMLPPALFIMYGMTCSYLPFSVFFRTLSLKFLARLSEHYNLFDYPEKPL